MARRLFGLVDRGPNYLFHKATYTNLSKNMI